MRVAVAALGRFHAWDLARELARHKVLGQLYTGYPKAKVWPELRPYARTCPWMLVPYMVLGRMGQERLQRALEYRMARLFDRWLRRQLLWDDPTPDIIHAWASYAPETSEWARLKGIRVICDRGSTHVLHQLSVLLHEYSLWGQAPPINTTGIHAELRQYWASNLIIVPSEQAKATFAPYGHRVETVPYGVDLARFQTAQFPHEQPFRVLYVGTLSLRKGLPYLMEAVRQLKIPNLEVWLVGTRLAEAEPFLRHLTPFVKVWGPIPQEQLPSIYQQASVLVLPSLEEGLALVLGQALACELPIIATRESGAEEYITHGQHGLLIASRNAEAIRSPIQYLAEHPDVLAGMRKEIWQMRGRLSWEHYGNRMMQVYESILA